MTLSAIAHSNAATAEAAGSELAQSVTKDLHGAQADVLIVFASSRYDYPELLQALSEGCKPGLIVGCSSAGEFTSESPQISSACVVALKNPEMKFSAGLAEGLQKDRKKAAADLVSSFQGLNSSQYVYRSAMVLIDALAGFSDALVEEITLATGGMYQFFGGGAGDDAQFQRTHVFLGTKAYTDAAVALEILSNKPVGIGVRHGWEPAGAAMRVTEAEGNRLISLNAIPAVEAFASHAAETGQIFNPEEPLPFFLANVIGIDSGGTYRLRVPLGVNEDGSVTCAADVPVGSTVHLMRATEISSAKAAQTATESAIAQLNAHPPKVAIFFDCVATRLRTGKDFGLELQALENSLTPAAFVGCNTYGQIARAEGQFGGFHNCTAVIGIIPD
ncbi:MAG TPA: FIST N-terminal domain-containing protein [Patescibacteria group bacterium]|nr:FIST N-terminal domain-containing protein [Patescibacteria group bacterium]